MLKDTVKVYKKTLGAKNSFNEDIVSYDLLFTTSGLKEKSRGDLVRSEEGIVVEERYNAYIPYDVTKKIDRDYRIEWIDQYNNTTYYKVLDYEIMFSHHIELKLEAIPNI